MSETLEAPALAVDPVDVAAAEAPVEVAATETPAEPEPKAERKDWRETRIGQLTREMHEAKREAELYKHRLSAIEAGATDKPAEGFVPETEVDRRAAAMLAQQEYAARTASVIHAGDKEFKDFTERCATVAGFGLAPAQKPEFMQTIAELPDGHKVIAHLADNADLAMQLAQAPAHRMAVRLAAIAADLSKPPPVSKAPPPLEAPRGAVTPSRSIYDPNISTEEYSRLRREERAARRR